MRRPFVSALFAAAVVVVVVSGCGFTAPAEGEGEGEAGEGEGEGEGEEGEGEGEGEGEEGEGEEGEGEGEGEVPVPDDGDSCVDPILLEEQPAHIVGSSQGYTDQYNARFLGDCTGHTSAGADTAFVINLALGDTLDVTVTPVDDTFDDVSVYVLENCIPPNESIPDACLEGADADFAGFAETLSFTSGIGGVHTYFLIVDSINDDRGYGWELDWSVR